MVFFDLESGECVSFQGFAIAGPGAEIRQTAGNCAISPDAILCDSKRFDFGEQIENKDIAELPAISFLGMKAFSGEKISSLQLPKTGVRHRILAISRRLFPKIGV